MTILEPYTQPTRGRHGRCSRSGKLGLILCAAGGCLVAAVPATAHESVTSNDVASTILIAARNQADAADSEGAPFVISPEGSQPPAPAEDPGIEIVPRKTERADESGPALAPDAEEPGTADEPQDKPYEIDDAKYREVYRSIPFSRSQYDADPRYRHRVTMEILTGEVWPRDEYEVAAVEECDEPAWPWVYPTPYRSFFGLYGVNFNLWWRRVPQFYYPYQFSYPPFYYPQWALPYPY